MLPKAHHDKVFVVYEIENNNSIFLFEHAGNNFING
jgi:hypothetical protein